MKAPTLYDRLGVSMAADADVVAAAYKALSKRHHPDMGGDAEKFMLIQEAYDVLSDPIKRGQYDAQLKFAEATKKGKREFSKRRAEKWRAPQGPQGVPVPPIEEVITRGAVTFIGVTRPEYTMVAQLLAPHAEELLRSAFQQLKRI